MSASGRLRPANEMGMGMQLMGMGGVRWVQYFSRKGLVTSFCLSVGVLLSSSAMAYHLPKWEVGLGAGVLNLPTYRGAKDRTNVWLPVPFLAYRSDFIKIDEEGARGQLLQTNGLHLDFSLAGSLPVSDGDGARKGMPSLDPIGEIGPSLEWRIASNGERLKGWEQQWWLRLPLRAALSVGDPLVGYRGWVFSPFLNWVWVKGASHSRWRWSLSAGPLYANQQYHDYFYSVSSDFVNANRAEYEATAGYSGRRATLSLSVNSRKWFVGAFARYDDLHGATFEDSPLVETHSYLAVGIAISRVFKKSSEHAPHGSH